MSCNQRIISCKSAIPLLLRDRCRNSQFLFPSPYFLIIEEERTCEGITQLNSGQTNVTKTHFFCSHVIFSLRALRIFSRKVLKTPRLCLWRCKGRWWRWSCGKPKVILDETFSSFTTTLCTDPALAPLLRHIHSPFPELICFKRVSRTMQFTWSYFSLYVTRNRSKDHELEADPLGKSVSASCFFHQLNLNEL